MQFEKQEGTKFTVVAKPFYLEGEQKVYVPVDTANGLPVWTADNIMVDGEAFPPLLTVSADGMICEITIPDLPVTVTDARGFGVVYSCDAQLGAGTSPLSREFTVIVLPKQAADVDFEEVVG